MNDALSQSGFDRNRKSLFIMEGLTYYISEKAIKDTLYFIKNYSGTGSTVAFDYFYQSFIGGKSNYHGAKEIFESVLKLVHCLHYIDGFSVSVVLRIKAQCEGNGSVLVKHCNADVEYHRSAQRVDL